MNQLTYNQEESKFIDQVHLAFPKVELDPNVAIGQVNHDGSKYTYHSTEAETFEAFFRGISHRALIALGIQGNNFFYPAKHKPLPWWQVPLDEMHLHFWFDDIFRMSPYGKYYYLPYFMLVQIHRLNVIRCGQEKNSWTMADDLWHSLIVPDKVIGNCWDEINSLPLEYRDLLNKKDIFKMMEKEGQEYIVFLSFFNEAQKRVVSKLIRYGVNISFEFMYDSEYKDAQEMLERLKSVWSF